MNKYLYAATQLATVAVVLHFMPTSNAIWVITGAMLTQSAIGTWVYIRDKDKTP